MKGSINKMFNINDSSKILLEEKRTKKCKLSRDELEALLDRSVSREEWKYYQDHGVDTIKEENVVDHDTYTVEITKQRDEVLKDTSYTLKTDEALPLIIHDISNDIKDSIGKKGIIKFKIVAVIKAINPLTNSIVENFAIDEKWDVVSTKDVLELDDILYNHLTTLQNQFEERNEGESGLVYQEISKIISKITEAPNKAAGSYIKLRKSISDKKATINVKNEDNECFKWAVLASSPCCALATTLL